MASSLDQISRFLLRDQTRQNPDDANDIRVYLDTMFIKATSLATLHQLGIATDRDCTVTWATWTLLRPLTRFGLLVRSALLNGGGHVIEGARIEGEARAEWNAHRTAPGHDPAACGWAKCSGELCYWPLREDALV